MKLSWIPIEKIQFYIQIDSYVFFWILLIFSFLFYKTFLRKLSERRHKNLKKRFESTLFFLLVSTILSGLYWLMNRGGSPFEILVFKIDNYIALTSFVLGAIVSIKVAQIYIYLYLFFMNMKVGVPRLIGNLFTFVFSLLVFGYLGAEVFGVHFKTMLATSAFFSIVLGLALQDTLGNLFSGVAMQIGRPFSIGDWVEITNGTDKWLGQIQDITWRATFIITFSEEQVLIPNKVMAQGQITLLSNPHRPVRHNLHFRFDFSADFKKIEAILLEEALKHTGILKSPEPLVLLIETTESVLSIKIFYSVAEYSLRFRVASTLLGNILDELKKNGIPLAVPKLELKKES